MSKERLEEIKENWNNVVWGIDKSDINWLIEQAERLHGTKHKKGYMDMYADCNRMVGSDSMKIHKLEQQNKELLEGLATIGNAIHEGEISGRGTDENLILEIVDKHWRNQNE